jgi:hypothetical protein
MFFLKKLKYKKKLFKIKFKKVYLKKKLKKLKNQNFFYKKKKIFKIKNLIFFYKKNFYKNNNLYNFFYKYFKLNKKKKTIFFFNSFFFINIIKKKNNIFFNVSDLKKNVIFSNSLKSLKILKKKKDILKKNIISIFFLISLKKFFKNIIFEKFFNLLPNIYFLSENKQSLLLKKLVRILLKFIYFFVNLFIVPGSNKFKKYLFAIKKTIKSLRYKKKIKILSLNLKYQNSFNGCKLRKLKRI